MIVNATRIQAKNTVEIQLLTQLNDDKNDMTLCPNLLNETVTVWSDVWNYAKVWSCYELTKGKEIFHDTALFFGVNEDYPRYPRMYKEMVENFKSRAKLFFAFGL